MNRYTQSISFKQRAATGTEADYAKGFIITAWITYVGGSIRNPVTGEFYCDVVNSQNTHRPGRTYHLFLKSGDLIHTGGFDKANHFIKLPLSWKDETHEIISIPETIDENGEVVQAREEIITNSEYYHSLIFQENSTHCLVKLIDSTYSEFKDLITETADNIYAEAYYFKQLEENYIAADGTVKQGEFYVESENTEM